MVRRSHLLASVALFSFSATVVSAETIVIDGGFLLLTGPSEIGSVAITGTRGFSLTGPVNTSEGGTLAFSECTSFECQPGQLIDLRASFGDLAFPGNLLTLDGQEFTLTGETSGNIGLPLLFSGSTTLPPLGTMPPIVRAPFTLEGTLAFLPFGPIHDLTGRGMVEVSLIEGFEPDTATRGWTIDAIRWEFEDAEPIPEPGTVLLVASGAAVLARVRRRRRGGTNVLAPLVVVALLPSAAFAEPIIVNSGSILLTGLSEIGHVSIAGTRGFSLAGSIDTSEGGTAAFFDCNGFVCPPGTRVDLKAGFGDLAFGPNTFTLDGEEHILTGGVNGMIAMFLSLSGETVLPPLGTLPALTRTPFTMDGFIFFSPFGPRHELTGRGVVEVALSQGLFPGEPGPAWAIDSIRWEFEDAEPVPEPGTMLLVASGMAVLARRRQRSHHPKLRSSAVGP